ncbi:MAG TPA: hypothetical protein VNI55_08265 [Gaiellaceae bacterium]|nr:hypothetical protein [Gaiellaceae bacterium]
MNASWNVEGEDTAARPREWITRAGFEGWVLHEEAADALTSAVAWNGGSDEATIQRWLDYYAREGIERVAIGVLVLRARAGEGWTRSRVLTHGPRAAGPALERLFTGADTAANVLATLRLLPAPDLEIEQAIRRGSKGWELARALLRTTGGLPFETSVDDTVLDFVRGLDGRPLSSFLATVAPATRPEVLAVARGRLELGFLVPAE